MHFCNEPSLFLTLIAVEKIPGYSHRSGNCPGTDIKHITHVKQPKECAAECNRLKQCKSFLWVSLGRYANNCWLKKSLCHHLRETSKRNYHFYTKTGQVSKTGVSKPGNYWVLGKERGYLLYSIISCLNKGIFHTMKNSTFP